MCSSWSVIANSASRKQQWNKWGYKKSNNAQWYLIAVAMTQQLPNFKCKGNVSIFRYFGSI
jgi:hypothetical protein